MNNVFKMEDYKKKQPKQLTMTEITDLGNELDAMYQLNLNLKRKIEHIRQTYGHYQHLEKDIEDYLIDKEFLFKWDTQTN